MKKHTDYMIFVIALWLVFALWAWFRTPDAFSDTERRSLAQFPKISAESLKSGRFMEEFDRYSLDQFPLRNSFRQLKANIQLQLLRQKDNNGIYLAQGHAIKMEYPLNLPSFDRAMQLFNQIQTRYLADSSVFFALIPDKGYYLAENNGYPAMDYETAVTHIQTNAPNMNYINLFDCLSADSYYRTDTHWRQECLLPAAERICNALDVSTPKAEDYRLNTAQRPFYGVYYGQAAVSMEPDSLVMLENDLLNQCKVLNYETGSYGKIYDSEKLSGKDMYEAFLSGSVSLLTIENPLVNTSRELILFRDSFGSSLAPLLIQGYQKITLIDIRYLSSGLLDRFVDFHGQDVLFLYSTLVLNNSSTLK